MPIYTPGRRRTILILLLTSVMLITIDLRGNALLNSARSGFDYAFRPFEIAAEVVSKPVVRAWDGITQVDDLQATVAEQQRTIDQMRSDSIAGQNALIQNRELRRQVGLKSLASYDLVTCSTIGASPSNQDQVVEIDCGPEVRYQPTVALLEALEEPVDGLVVASPANPTGTMIEAAELAALAMPRARLAFEVTPLPEPGPHGADQVVLVFSANPGSAPAPLAKVASGGELSRVRLALEVVLAQGAEGHTFVFDEVDAGVGGAVALEIGRRLARLAEHAQVVVVTHLAQVAAFADRHFVVHKADDGQVTTSGVREVAAADRVDELARMMAGLEGTDAARAHAAELLAEASRG